MTPVFVVTPVDSGDNMWVGLECLSTENSCIVSIPFEYEGLLSVVRTAVVSGANLPKAEKCPEFIGFTRNDVLSLFPDLAGVDTFTDWETGEGYERPRLLKHSWDL